MEEIKNALQALRDEKSAYVSAEANFCARCSEFVNLAKEFMKITNTTSVEIGDARQGVSIPETGRIDWKGIVNSVILEGYEKELLSRIQKETARIRSTYEKYL